MRTRSKIVAIIVAMAAMLAGGVALSSSSYASDGRFSQPLNFGEQSQGPHWPW